MSNVYYTSIKKNNTPANISNAVYQLVKYLVEVEAMQLERSIPLKVHFGERGNHTFVTSDYMQGIIDYLREQNVEPYYIETNVLYKSDRTQKDSHIKLARDHGFTQLPITIADGDIGEDYYEVPVKQKHFKTCKIGAAFKDVSQMIVVSHFKGHIVAGFGGAIKQLSMGCAARGGKLAMHSHALPSLKPSKCTRCGLCVDHCPGHALSLGETIIFDRTKCTGCAACLAICPHDAIKVNWGNTEAAEFLEKLAEHALAAQKGKSCIYVNYAIKITDNCDCMDISMQPIADDLAVMVSTDPVAIDLACMDMLDQREPKPVFGGRDIFKYAEAIGLGSMDYQLIQVVL
ncbi:DUF362 domain-containing protein [Candidatus Margulisiibacteriota bacterium]